MDVVRYVDQWRTFAGRLAQAGRFEVASEVRRGYSADELNEMEGDIRLRFAAPGFSIPEPLRTLLGVTLSLRVQWKLPGSTPVVGSVRLTPQDVFETDEESGIGHVEFWNSERVLEPISDTQSVVAVFTDPNATSPALHLRDGDARWPLEITVEGYLERAWRFRGLYGWQHALATGGDTEALERRLADALGPDHG